MPKLNQQEKIVLIGAAAVGVLYFGLLNPLLHFLGVKTSQDTVSLDQQATDPGSFWNPNFYKQISSPILLTRASGEALARSLYDCFGMFNDDEEQAKGIIKSLSFQTQLSYLADVFYQLYQQDLLSFLRGGNWPQDRLSDADVNELTKFVQKLPLK